MLKSPGWKAFYLFVIFWNESIKYLIKIIDIFKNKLYNKSKNKNKSKKKRGEFIMVRARITSRGQITIPKKVREKLGAKPGNDLEFEVIDEKRAIIKITEVPTAEKLAGSLNPEGIEGEDEDWNRAINKEQMKKWKSELEGD